LKVADIKKNYIDNYNIKYIQKFKESEFISKNTLLITRKGTVGNSIFIQEDKKYTASSEIFIIKLSEIIDGDYLAEVNLSEFVQKQYIEKNTGTIMPSLSQDKLKEILIPLPPLDIQKKISNHIGSIKKKVSELLILRSKTEHQAKQEFEKTIFS
jgi:type I restriction enzyme M protein